jgi:hypothetical protein
MKTYLFQIALNQSQKGINADHYIVETLKCFTKKSYNAIIII